MEIMAGRKAVSYTHLDVYKRQILLFHHCFLNAQRWATVPYEKLATTKGWGYYPISFAPFSSHTIQYLASFSKICVAMFVFMTGYGMWVSYESQKKKTTMSNYIKKRMVTLMTGFLIIFVVTEAVSYTHLDVYKRQNTCIKKRMLQ